MILKSVVNVIGRRPQTMFKVGGMRKNKKRLIAVIFHDTSALVICIMHEH